MTALDEVRALIEAYETDGEGYSADEGFSDDLELDSFKGHRLTLGHLRALVEAAERPRVHVADSVRRYLDLAVREPDDAVALAYGLLNGERYQITFGELRALVPEPGYEPVQAIVTLPEHEQAIRDWYDEWYDSPPEEWLQAIDARARIAERFQK